MSTNTLDLCCHGFLTGSVHKVLTSRGWLPLEDKTSTAFTLKWVETNKQINYKYICSLTGIEGTTLLTCNHTHMYLSREFREGEQLVNHFPNISLLTTKIGLLESLRALQRVQHTTRVRCDSYCSLYCAHL